MNEQRIPIGPTTEFSLRVSVATLSRVVLKNPADGITMLALENKATLLSRGQAPKVDIRAQPFGGAVRILDVDAFISQVGSFRFDSERSRYEQDFRVYIRSASWPALREYCLDNLFKDHPGELESDPSRELEEEFSDTLGIQLEPGHYSAKPLKIVVENEPVMTGNIHAAGNPTVRVYQVDEIHILDPGLAEMMIANSDALPGSVLHRLAIEDADKGGQGRANSMLVAPMNEIRDCFLKIPPDIRGERQRYGETFLAGNVAAVLDEIYVPKYQQANQ